MGTRLAECVWVYSDTDLQQQLSFWQPCVRQPYRHVAVAAGATGDHTVAFAGLQGHCRERERERERQRGRLGEEREGRERGRGRGRESSEREWEWEMGEKEWREGVAEGEESEGCMET